MNTGEGTSGQPSGRVLVIFPFQQLFLPEFDAYGMFRGLDCSAYVFSGDMKEKLSKDIRASTPQCRVLPLSGLLTYKFSFIRNLEKLLSDLEPTAVVTYEIYSSFSYQVARLRRKMEFTHIVVCYETIPSRRSLWGHFPLTRLFASLVRRRADLFVALSERIREALTLSGVPADRIRTFYPGVPHTAARRHGRKGKFKILFLGRLRTNKGIGTLISAYRSLPGEMLEDTELIVAGDGPLETMVTDAAATTPGIRFTGFVYGKDKEALIEEADVFIYPSEDQMYPFGLKRWEEQTAAAVREAMSAGIPVVASDSGSLPEVVGRGDMIFRQGDYRQLSGILQKLYASESLLGEVSSYNASRAASLFGMAGFASNIEKTIIEGAKHQG